LDGGEFWIWRNKGDNGGIKLGQSHCHVTHDFHFATKNISFIQIKILSWNWLAYMGGANVC